MATETMEFTAVEIHKLTEGVPYREPYYLQPDIVYAEASALEVMTDLNFVPAATVRVGATLKHTQQAMMDRGVRMMLVVDDHKRVQGLLTATDIRSESTERLARGQGVDSLSLTVDQVMVPVDKIDVISLVDVVHARVGDIVATLQSSGRQHALVVDRETPDDALLIRGIFSAAQIARQLGIPVHQGGSENDFGDLENTFAKLHEHIRRVRDEKRNNPKL